MKRKARVRRRVTPSSLQSGVCLYLFYVHLVGHWTGWLPHVPDDHRPNDQRRCTLVSILIVSHTHLKIFAIFIVLTDQRFVLPERWCAQRQSVFTWKRLHELFLYAVRSDDTFSYRSVRFCFCKYVDGIYIAFLYTFQTRNCNGRVSGANATS